jgi:hypothetical protein
MMGPGKYDELCTLVRRLAGIGDTGAVVVIVIGGDKGHGFSCQGSLTTTVILPPMLRQLADQIERDFRADKAE